MPQRKSKFLLLGGAAISILFVAPLALFAAFLLPLTQLFGGDSSPYCSSSTGMSASLSLGTTKGAAERYFAMFAPADRAEREKNAGIIIAVGRSRSLSDRTIAIAVATAIQESGLRNLAYGDLDSLGLFQQRPSQGWGTAEQILDPVYASNAFYDQLVKVSDRDQRPMIDVAIQIQRPNATYYRRDWDWTREQAAPDMVASAPKDASQPKAAAQVSAICHNSPSVTAQFASVRQPLIGSGAVAIRGDDYPYASFPIGIGSPLSYKYRECVDFVAWRLNEQAGITTPPFKFTNLGNAVDWLKKLTDQGYRADSTPAVGAVAWFGANAGDATLKAGELGHVAIVSAINQHDGSIVIEQYNMSPYADHAYSVMTLPASYLHNITFIHVVDRS